MPEVAAAAAAAAAAVTAVQIATVERLVRVEVRVETMTEKINHIDLCVDDLKRTIWKASGSAAVIILAAGWILKHT